MSNNACGDSNILQQHNLRSWIQLCGCRDRSCDALHYFGSDCHLFEVAVSEEYIQGSLMPIRVLRGTNGEWCQVGTVARPPGRQRFVLNYFEPCVPYLPFFHSIGDNSFNVYETVGECDRPSDPGNGWSNYVQIYSNVRLETRRSTTRTSRASQAPIDNQLLGTVDCILRYAPTRTRLANADESFVSKTVALTYDCGETCPACLGSGGGCQTCGGCGLLSISGCPEERFYALKINNDDDCRIFIESYLQDQGKVTSTYFGSCTSICNGASCPVIPTDIAIHNGQLMVSIAGNSPEVGVYAAALLGGGTLGPFRRIINYPVQSLFSNGEWLFMGGAAPGSYGGRISMIREGVCNRSSYVPYRHSSVVSFNDIDGCGNNLLAGGDSGALAASNNGGQSFRRVNSPTTDDITSVALNQSDYWVGTATGDLYMSCSGGLNWALVASVTKNAEIQLSGSVEGGAINCLEFANNYIGYFTSGDELYGTYNRGDFWAKGCPRFDFAPDVNTVWESDMSYSALAIPSCAKTSFSAGNNFILASNTTTANPAHTLVMVGEPLIEGALPMFT